MADDWDIDLGPDSFLRRNGDALEGILNGHPLRFPLEEIEEILEHLADACLVCGKGTVDGLHIVPETSRMTLICTNCGVSHVLVDGSLCVSDL